MSKIIENNPKTTDEIFTGWRDTDQPIKNYIKAIQINQAILFLGKAGVGKSVALKQTREWFESQDECVGVVSYTGTGAMNVGGRTINSLFRIRPAYEGGNELVPEIIPASCVAARENTQDWFFLKASLKDLTVILIDEVSMLGGSILREMDFAMKKAKHSSEFMGGCKVIMFGDFFQLGPVKDSWLFNHELISELIVYDRLKVIEPTEVYRQDSKEFLETLGYIREGFASMTKEQEKNVFSFLSSKVTEKRPKNTIVLAGANNIADKYNLTELAKLKAKAYTLKFHIEGQAIKLKDSDKGATKDILSLKRGARIVFTRNDAIGRYCNGSTGTFIGPYSELKKYIEQMREEKGEEYSEMASLVTEQNKTDLMIYQSQLVEKKNQVSISMKDENIMVCYVDGYNMPILVPKKVMFEECNSKAIEKKKKNGGTYTVYEKIVIAEYWHWDFVLGYAITIHKSQGMTLPSAYIDFTKKNGVGVWAGDGSVYTALSRIKTPEGVFLRHPIPLRIITTSPEVTKFFNKIRKNNN